MRLKPDRRTKVRRQALIGGLMILLAATAFVTLSPALGSSGRAKGAEAPASETRATSYRAPTGPEITPTEAVAIATSQARNAESPACNETGCYLSGFTVATAHGLFGQAQAVAERRSPRTAQLVQGNPEMDEWQQSSAYLVVMESNTPFTLDVSHPRKQPAPSGNVFSMIVDAHTGFVEGRTLGPEAPDAAALGPVIASTAAREAVASDSRPEGTVAVAARGGVRPGEYVRLKGQVHLTKGAARGWRVVVGRNIAKPEYTKNANSSGRFTVRVRFGTYQIAAQRPKDGLCGKRTVTLPRHSKPHITLHC
jgi:hypothetical protein